MVGIFAVKPKARQRRLSELVDLSALVKKVAITRAIEIRVADNIIKSLTMHPALSCQRDENVS